MGQNKRTNCQFDGSAEFLSLGFFGPMGRAERGCFNIDDFLAWSFAGSGDWPDPFTCECWELCYRQETTGNS